MTERACRVCTGFGQAFKDFEKNPNKKKNATSSSTSSSATPSQKQQQNNGNDKEISHVYTSLRDSEEDNCPEDSFTLGKKSWGFLHTMAAYYPDKPTETDQNDMKDMMRLWGKFYPCHECADDFREDLKKYPPQVESRSSLSRWLCEQHNRVNVKLGKEEFDCDLVDERWRDGWADGSCD
eukprot:m.111101 g.111101  ORF g.111101 m.111101 type:complete len:180 (-) comp12761_c9_seq1:736-1275(-)